ncbi:DUF4258 domain-containing protein [Thermostichus vulcanus]|uniref:DUF4258 domain-containing protein n=1 Tax=Thermostichus vulcanus str. 'Rupite' TaxID=2813851 RepID=A0ABT0CFC6_THEVL|nr:DUF4258 domain-containing protein [Thermostichus vulcanus str. 'Rupite']
MSQDYPYRLSQHFLDRLSGRNLSLEWVIETVEAPTLVEPDPQDPTLRLAFRAIPSLDGRVMRVVYNWTTDPWTLVTAHLDRSKRGKL